MRRLARSLPAAVPPALLRRVAGTALSAAALAVAAVIVVPVALGYRHYVITGGSMEPGLPAGSLALTRPAAVGDLGVGDVITYVPPPGSGVSGAVTHRVVAIEPGPDGNPVFHTRGDANASPDPWTFTLDSEVQPRVAFHVPFVGRIIGRLGAPGGRLLLIGVPAALIALLSAADLRAALRSRREAPGAWAGGPA